MREIALDTETTGLDPASGHRIVEIGCVEMISHVRTGRVYHTYLNPERDMPEEAERVHGLSADFLSDKPLFRDTAQNFLAFIRDAKLVIHNAAFDMKFINAELKNIGCETIPMDLTIDTVQMARQKFPGQPANLDALCRRFNIDLSARTKHGALLDAELLSDVYLELTGGRQASLGLAAEHSQTVENHSYSLSIEIPEREFRPSQEELEAHRRFIELLTDPLWKKIAS